MRIVETKSKAREPFVDDLFDRSKFVLVDRINNLALTVESKLRRQIYLDLPIIHSLSIYVSTEILLLPLKIDARTKTRRANSL